MNRPILLALVSTVLLTSGPGLAAPAEVYTQPFYQSPVRAEPDELLMIPGWGFVEGAVVAYRKIDDTTQPLTPPLQISPVTDANEGVAPVVSCTTDRLVVHLPAVMTPGQSYALWVRNPGEPFSEGFRINDARPLWLTPEQAYTTASLASLPRELKVVGRNLEPALTAPGGKTRVRLVGPQTFLLDAVGEAEPALEHYVARVSLPVTLPVGSYTVGLTRDGVSWLDIPDQELTVLPDPVTTFSIDVASLDTPEEPCAPNDNKDDAHCIKEAIELAGAAGGGDVVFAAGRWEMRDLPDVSSNGLAHGVLVHDGVNLIGQGSGSTEIVRTDDWGWVPGVCVEGVDLPCVIAVFTLQGNNVVSDLHFHDEFPDKSFRSFYFFLGKRPWWALPTDPTWIENVVFTRNLFTDMHAAIGDGNFPMRHLYIVDNEFEAYHDDLFLGGNRTLRDVDFRVDDSVIAFNDFYPGGYYAPEIGQGVIASQIGASYRVDFSGNTAHRENRMETCDTDPFYNGCGWRAGFFWHMSNTLERMLVSQNTLACTGDKAGDGEAIVTDNNGNIPAFESARAVLDATSTTVTVPGPWLVEGTAANDDLDHYNEYWMQIVDGRGIGQAREVESCCCGSACATPQDSQCGAPCDDSIVITVDPPWDVVPQPGFSKATMQRTFWQMYTVDNEVDISGCEKDNPTQPRAGVICYWGSAWDTTIEANTQTESDGIRLGTGYSIESRRPESGEVFTSWAQMQYFLEIRGNEVLGEFNFNDCEASPDYCPRITCRDHCCADDECDASSYDADTYCIEEECCDGMADCNVPLNSWSGIDMMMGQYPLSDAPVVAYGINVVDNTVDSADGLRGGAIAVNRGWHPPPTAGHNLYKNVVVQHNAISNLERRNAQQICLPPLLHGLDGGIGIHLSESYVHDSTLYDNDIQTVCWPIEDDGTETVRLIDCPTESICGGPGCNATGSCTLTDLDANACLRPDGSVMKCGAYESLQMQSCDCTGAGCATNDNQLVCVPDPTLPGCPQEEECGIGCTADTNCFFQDSGDQACLRDDQSVMACPDGETVHLEHCLCSGGVCSLFDSHLVCRPILPVFPGSPGRVPTTVLVERSTEEPGDLALSWDPSCSSGAADYGIYEGQIGDWGNHQAIDCQDAGANRVERVTPAAGNTYYLVVPNTPEDDGSFGLDSNGAERPVAPTTTCRNSQNQLPC